MGLVLLNLRVELGIGQSCNRLFGWGEAVPGAGSVSEGGIGRLGALERERALKKR
jgi:hypothetical protein